MSAKELLNHVINRLTLFRRANALLCAISPILFVFVAVLAYKTKTISFGLTLFSIVLWLVVTVFLAHTIYRYLKKPRNLEAGEILDKTLQSKERFLTLATLQDYAQTATKESLTVIEEQGSALAPNFNIKKDLPFKLYRPTFYSLAASPFLTAILIFLVWQTLSAPNFVDGDIRQIIEEKIDRLRDLAENSPTLPEGITDNLLALADLLEEEGLESSDAMEILEKTLSDISVLPNPEESNLEKEKRKDIELPEPEDGDKKKQSTPEQKKDSPSNEKEKSKPQDSAQNESSENKESAQQEDSRPEENDKKDESSSSGKQQGEDKAGGQQQKQQGEDSEEKKGESEKEQGESKETGGSEDDPNKDKTGSGAGKGDNKKGEQQPQKGGESGGDTGEAGKGASEGDAKNDADTGSEENRDENLQTKSGGKDDKSDKTEITKKSGDGKGEEQQKETAGEGKGDGKEKSSEQEKVKEELEDLKNKMKDNKQGEGDNKGKGEQEDSAANEEKKGDTGKGSKPSDSDNKSKDNKLSGEKSAEKLNEVGEEKSSDKKDSGDKEKGADKKAPEDATPEKARTGDEDGDLDNDKTKSDGTPKKVPTPSDTAPRFGPFSEGDEGALSGEGKNKTRIEVPLEQKIVVHQLGAEDPNLYKNPKEARAKTKLTNEDFVKPESDVSEGTQPIPVEYLDILR